MRRAFSCEDLNGPKQQWNGTDGTKVDEDYDDDSLDDKESRLGSDDSRYDILQHRRYSFPLIGKTTEEVLDPFFSNQLTKIKNAVKEEQYKDNVYADVKREDVFGR